MKAGLPVVVEKVTRGHLKYVFTHLYQSIGNGFWSVSSGIKCPLGYFRSLPKGI